MRKKRMERELNHPHFVGVRLTDIELRISNWNFWTGKQRSWECPDPNACGNFWWTRRLCIG